MIDRMETSLSSLEARMSARFDRLERGHERLEGRIDKISEECGKTTAAISRIEGERTGERRVPALGKRLTLWSSIVGGFVAAFAALAAAWTSLTGHVVSQTH